MTNIVAIIPARSGSKSIKDKNLVNLGSNLLIDWSIKTCLRSRLIDKVFVSTDSEKYKKLCEKFGAEVPCLRPKEISQDNSTDYEFMQHAIDNFFIRNKIPDFIVHIRPTTPFRTFELVDKGINTFINNSYNFTSLRSIHKMSESAYKSFEVSHDGILKSVFTNSQNLDKANLPRQSFPDTFAPNGYVDVLSSKFIIEKKLLHGHKVFAFETPVVTEIDSMDDFKYLEYQLKKFPILKKQVFG